MPHAERAFQLAEHTSEQEALFIRGSYYSLKADHQSAIPYYEALLVKNPNHPWVINNLVRSYSQTGQVAKARGLERLRSSLRPNDPNSYRSQFPFCEADEDPSVEIKKAARAVELFQSSPYHTEYEIQLARARQAVIEAIYLWTLGRVTESVNELEKALGLLRPLDEDTAQAGFWRHQAAIGFLTMGQARRAPPEIRKSGISTVMSQTWEMWAAIHSGDRPAIRRLAASVQESDGPLNMTALALARAGLVDEASLALEKRKTAIARTPGLNDYWAGTVFASEGEIALQQGRLSDAVVKLTAAIDKLYPEHIETLTAPQALARAYRELGQVDEAIRVLEKATSGPRGCSLFTRASFWPHARYDLMELYRMRNRQREADVIRAELLKLLARADDDFPLKVRLLESASRPVESVRPRGARGLAAGL